MNKVDEYLSSLRDDEHYQRGSYDSFLRKNKLDFKKTLIHIAGINGVAEVGHYLENIYLSKGYKVGLFSSKETLSYSKMIKINGRPVSFALLESLKEEYQSQFEKYELTDLEIISFLAYKIFSKADLDLVIMESNIGGAFDPTKIEGINPTLSIITSVSLNLTYLLGKTESQIAKDFSSIIPHKGMTIIGKMEEEAKKVLRDESNKKDSSFFNVDDYHSSHFVSPLFYFSYRPFIDLAILSSASYMLPYAALAIEAVNKMQPILQVDEYSLRQGLLKPSLNCRFEKIGNIIFDVADNVEALKNMTKSLVNQTRGKNVHVLFASDREANIARILPILDNVTQDITLTTYEDDKARKEMDYFLFMGDHRYDDDPKLALQSLSSLGDDDILLVTGNVRFVYYLRDFLKGDLSL